MKKKHKRKKKKSKKDNWSAMDEIRHPVPKCGFAFKDRKRALKDEEDQKEMRKYK